MQAGGDGQTACASCHFHARRRYARCVLAGTDVARKLLPLEPLAKQTVDPNDSVLGSFRGSTYRALVEAAFGPNADFATVWGEAIAAYEETLP